MQAVRIRLRGQVQGCGVRPAVVRMACASGLDGWVANAGDQVTIHAQGRKADLDDFLASLPARLPLQAQLTDMHVSPRKYCKALNGFFIRRPGNAGWMSGIPEIPADTAICSACVEELFDPQSRRYRWPFVSCSGCGPRYAWLKKMPFLRNNTTFSAFTPCTACEQEYRDPSDRRFGMELIACAQCGPRLEWMDAAGQHRQGQDVWTDIAAKLAAGGVVALQGFSGFHLLASAANIDAVARLRTFKSRPHKPLAVMALSTAQIADDVLISAEEKYWLESPHRPIVLTRKKHVGSWQHIARDNPCLGIMLPQNGIQQLILQQLSLHQGNVSLVATSANRRGDPVAASVDELLPWLGKGIDAIGFHSIPVWQAQDDSVIALQPDGPLLLRRARGFAHQVLPATPSNIDILGQGAFLKSTVALRHGPRVVLSQYIGDLDNVAVQRRNKVVTERLQSLCNLVPDQVVTDAHPDNDFPADVTTSVGTVFHHRAHVAALVGEYQLTTPTLIAAWDGLGYGEDGRFWGSELFLFDGDQAVPVVGLQPFVLPGGDLCSREPWRVAVALLLEAGIDAAEILRWLSGKTGYTENTQALLLSHIHQAADTLPYCSSMGRFLEAVACLILDEFNNEFEGHVASALEYLANTPVKNTSPYFMALQHDQAGVRRWQWQSMIRALWMARGDDVAPAQRATSVFSTCVSMLINECQYYDMQTLGVTGGCFQNRLLLSALHHQCTTQNIHLLRPRLLPPNDGAIAYGQVNCF